MVKPINSNGNVIIVDIIMGNSKTSLAIRFMNETLDIQKFICVTSYLTKIECIKENVYTRNFVTSEAKHGSVRKYEHFKKLIGEGKDIVITHSLFSYANEELLNLLE